MKEKRVFLLLSISYILLQSEAKGHAGMPLALEGIMLETAKG